MEDIGKKIDNHIKLYYKGYKQCSECDEVFKPKGRNNKYCKICAKEKERERDKIKKEKKRKK